jgi:hypothetical protein
LKEKPLTLPQRRVLLDAANNRRGIVIVAGKYVLPCRALVLRGLLRLEPPGIARITQAGYNCVADLYCPPLPRR